MNPKSFRLKGHLALKRHPNPLFQRDTLCLNANALKRQEMGLRKSVMEAARGENKTKRSYVSKSDRLGSSDVWLKSPGT